MRTKEIKIKEAETYKGSSAKEWRDLYGFSIVRQLEKKQISLTHYNKKVSALQFNLSPGITCPGQTEMCKVRGYCHKIKYDNVLRTFKQNTEAARKPGIFKKLMINCLNEYSKTGGKWFRYHSYGDIFSQKYLDSIFEIAEKFPEIQFLTHTKSYWFDYSGKPDNFSIYFSIFPDSKKEIEKNNHWNFPYSIAGDYSNYKGKREELAYESLICPASCKNCRICWKGKETVRFNWH